MKDMYLSIKNKIISNAPLIKYVALFNNQFQRSNNDDIDSNIEQAFRYPCAFIEFPEDNGMLSQGAGAKRLDVLVRIHIGFESYKLEDVAFWDTVQSVQVALENWHDTSFTPLTYVAQRPDYDHNNVYIFQYDFRTCYSDNLLYSKRNNIPTSGLKVNAAVIIVDHL